MVVWYGYGLLFHWWAWSLLWDAVGGERHRRGGDWSCEVSTDQWWYWYDPHCSTGGRGHTCGLLGTGEMVAGGKGEMVGGGGQYHKPLQDFECG